MLAGLHTARHTITSIDSSNLSTAQSSLLAEALCLWSPAQLCSALLSPAFFPTLTYQCLILLKPAQACCAVLLLGFASVLPQHPTQPDSALLTGAT